MRVLTKFKKPKATRRLGGALGLLLALSLVLMPAVPALAVPQMPHQFYGTVTIGEYVAPEGTIVSAQIGVKEYASTTVDAEGRYGYSPDYGGTGIFKVPADDPGTPEKEGGVAGETVDFYVLDTLADQYEFEIWGITELNLTVAAVAPSVAIGAASSVTTTSATLNGNLDNLGTALSVEVSFEWGTTEAYGAETAARTMTATGPFSFSLSGLSPSTTYHFRAVAVGDGTSYGLDGTFTTATPPAPGGGGGPPPPPPGTTDVRGIVSTEGVFLSPVPVISEDGLCNLTIPAGTVGLTEDLEPLTEISMLIMDDPPPPPEEAHVIGLAYDFQPSGATFEPSITLTFSYDPANIPEGVAEEDLVLAFYIEGIPPEPGEWVELPCTVDPVTNTITASVSHFTTFAIIGAVPPPPPAPAAFALSNLTVHPAEVQPREAVTVAVHVANTGGTEGSYIAVLKINGVKEAEKSVIIAAGGREIVTFSVAKEDAASYSVTVDGLSGSFTVVPPPPAPAAFSVSNLSIQPAEVQPKEGIAVTIEVAVTNTGGTEGSYTLVLKINGVKEADRTVTIAAGDTLNLIFPVTKEAAGTYTVTVDGLSRSFTVLEPAAVTNWPLIGGIIGGVILFGLLLFVLNFIKRRRAY